ncbi:MAG: metallophosphatase family protein [Cytophagaceae bacterium]|nr:metallophosphatase family protein [Cytophagaceae bacterium]
MPTIGLISDTHGFLDTRVLDHFQDCDEIWHAGDFGTMEVADQLKKIKPLKGVYGNIDGKDIRMIYPKDLRFEMEGLNILITHIGGYPGHYAPEVKKELKMNAPDIFICGHSHILKVMTDKDFNNMICINPGAAGREGFHKVRTIIKFDILEKKISNMKAIELGKRG